MNTRRNAHAAQLAALALTGTACYLIPTHWIVSAILIYLAGLTAWCAGRLLQHEQRTRALHAQARAAAVSGQPALAPTPCCSFWKSSAVIHAPDCTRHQGTTT